MPDFLEILGVPLWDHFPVPVRILPDDPLLRKIGQQVLGALILLGLLHGPGEFGLELQVGLLKVLFLRF